MARGASAVLAAGPFSALLTGASTTFGFKASGILFYSSLTLFSSGLKAAVSILRLAGAAAGVVVGPGLVVVPWSFSFGLSAVSGF